MLQSYSSSDHGRVDGATSRCGRRLAGPLLHRQDGPSLRLKVEDKVFATVAFQRAAVVRSTRWDEVQREREPALRPAAERQRRREGQRGPRSARRARRATGANGATHCSREGVTPGRPVRRRPTGEQGPAAPEQPLARRVTPAQPGAGPRGCRACRARRVRGRDRSRARKEGDAGPQPVPGAKGDAGATGAQARRATPAGREGRHRRETGARREGDAGNRRQGPAARRARRARRDVHAQQAECRDHGRRRRCLRRRATVLPRRPEMRTPGGGAHATDYFRGSAAGTTSRLDQGVVPVSFNKRATRPAPHEHRRDRPSRARLYSLLRTGVVTTSRTASNKRGRLGRACGFRAVLTWTRATCAKATTSSTCGERLRRPRPAPRRGTRPANSVG